MRLFWLSLFVTSCTPHTGDSGKEGEGDTDEPTTCANDNDCAVNRICENETCVVGDRDNDATTAEPLVWETDTESEINPAGDVDWWALTVTEAQFVRVQVAVVEDPMLLDTVVSIYDSAGNRIAWEDEHPIGDVGTYNTVCYAYFSGAGTWYAKVEAIEHFEGTSDGGSDYYTLKAIPYDVGGETDSLSDAGGEVEMAGVNTWYGFPALQEEAGDVDYVVVDSVGDGGPLLFESAQNTEGSDTVPDITLYNEDGDVVLHIVDPSREDAGVLFLPLGTHYVLGVGDAGGGSGARAWSWTFLEEADPTGHSVELEPNDDTSVASTLTLYDQEFDAGLMHAGGGLGRLTDTDDADTWEFTVPFDDAFLSAYIGAQTYGALLVPRMEIYDGTGALLETVDSTPDNDESVENLGPWPAGTYHLRVSQAPEIAGEGGEGWFYSFSVYASSLER